MACDNGAATSGTGAAGGSGGGSGGSGATGPREPDPSFLPKPTAACPALTTGKVTFSPKDLPPRAVELRVSDQQGAKGPLVFFFHGAGGSPTELTFVLGSAVDDILAQGGTVAALYHDPSSVTLPWFLSLGGDRDDDLRVADEVLACLLEAGRVDTRRIHVVGFSAGAMHTEQHAARRSGYVASIVPYSGARLGAVTEQDPTNKYPAMLFHGGSSDVVIISFEGATNTYHEELETDGHFSFICNHNKGHTVPSDARVSAWQFLQHHPFGEAPEPYKNGLPQGFPSYCALDPASP